MFWAELAFPLGNTVLRDLLLGWQDLANNNIPNHLKTCPISRIDAGGVSLRMMLVICSSKDAKQPDRTERTIESFCCGMPVETWQGWY